MSSEILSILEYMEKEKGIDRADMISTISSALVTAAQKSINAGQELRIEIDPKTGVVSAWILLEVVDSLSDPKTQIHIEKATEFLDNPRVGQFVEKEIDPGALGRIAAQTARQAIMQRIRQFEKERVHEDYKDQVGQVVSGIVRRREKGDLVIEVGKAEAILPNRERVPGEDYSPGEPIRCLLLDLDIANRGPELILSRSNIRFVHRLFEMEVTEVKDGTVVIEHMAREPGYRTKIAVTSNDPKVDPVGACVGARGARVKTIVRELGGEKIDIIRYYPDTLKFLEEALKPVVPKNVKVEERDKRIHFEIADEDMALAIGRRGQNAKLTSKLMGWRLNIAKEETGGVGFEQRLARAVEGLHQIQGITASQAEQLVAIGINSPDAFEGVTASDLVDAGFTQEDADMVLGAVLEFQSTRSSPASG
ncbi:MAG: transcription termination factor NusA [Opitutae bacterium]|jgi:transcription termination/antitermination protein NusA|nr:transcription termination factor NusA [Opitutae bacterium]MBT4224766.1 transcription termination factor NusA [Opitutae bacterium]MBT5378819.1 transcription termination factor NusA [Opitutae bacterium]MBT5692308.1 transcription termination factor NusA [Opitutae bacterium]MBT6462908.1 transcription termination factor NusA [Opitutae bacterium]